MVHGGSLILRAVAPDGAPLAVKRFETGAPSSAEVMLAHGLPSGRPLPTGDTDPGYEGLARTLVERGANVSFLQFRGVGDSGGHLDVDLWPGDLGAALDAIEAQTGVKRFCLIASSTGGSAAVVRGADDSRIAHLVTLAAPADFDFLEATRDPVAWFDLYRELGMIRAGYGKTPTEWAEGFGRLKPAEAAPFCRAERVTLIHGESDEVVPVEHVRRLTAAFGGRATLHAIPNGAHQLRRDARVVALLESIVSEWSANR